MAVWKSNMYRRFMVALFLKNRKYWILAMQKKNGKI